ncbi:HEAT repeat domain-containing protein [Halorubrum halodurans]|uniref:HEAT repeat domain-containing protein n=1 Tax=Halorubrum halodurans TaxID=1383851 RepID=A0A256IMC8_9EURY|nr:HEAT repeat domain-containing protein [Halorubrum halodurans]OYR57322.1 hypothetical protein DJ70_06260 [Halorubrum halodurans]
MTANLTARQQRALDMADAAPADATDDNLDALLELTRHDDSAVRADAAQGVEMVAKEHPDLVADRLPDVIGLLHNPSVDVRTFGQDVVGILGSERPGLLAGTTAVRHLAQGLTDENEFVRAGAATRLGIVGEAAPDLLSDAAVLDALVAKAEGDTYTEARAQAVESLEAAANADPSLIDDRTVERLRTVIERDDVGGRVETAVEGIETAWRNRAASAGDGAGTEFCPACGAELDADPVPNFCRNCGQEL